MAVVVRAGGANSRMDILDVPERQMLGALEVAVECGYYEYVVLVRKQDDARLMILDSDLEIVAADMAEEPELMPLPLAGPGPSGRQPLHAMNHIDHGRISGYVSEFFHSLGPGTSAGEDEVTSFVPWTLQGVYCLDTSSGLALNAFEHVARKSLQIQKAVGYSSRATSSEDLASIVRSLHIASGATRTPSVKRNATAPHRDDDLSRRNARRGREEADLDQACPSAAGGDVRTPKLKAASQRSTDRVGGHDAADGE